MNNINNFPKDEVESLNAFYGRHKYDQKGNISERWEDQFLVPFLPSYRMFLSWDTEIPVRKIRANKGCWRSLSRVLETIFNSYDRDQEKIIAARMHLFGGCYNFRRARGLGRLSVHAWGAAIDLDPEKNPLGVKWEKNKGMMPEIVIDAFKAEGWTWGGDFKNRPDCMHFEATSGQR